MEKRTGAIARAVVSIGITVSDVDRAAGFFASALAFEKVAETRSAAPQLEQLFGVVSPEVRTVGMVLGSEEIELMSNPLRDHVELGCAGLDGKPRERKQVNVCLAQGAEERFPLAGAIGDSHVTVADPFDSSCH